MTLYDPINYFCCSSGLLPDHVGCQKEVVLKFLLETKKAKGHCLPVCLLVTFLSFALLISAPGANQDKSSLGQCPSKFSCLWFRFTYGLDSVVQPPLITFTLINVAPSPWDFLELHLLFADPQGDFLSLTSWIRYKENTPLVVLHWHNWDRLKDLKIVLWILKYRNRKINWKYKEHKCSPAFEIEVLNLS